MRGHTFEAKGSIAFMNLSPTPARGRGRGSTRVRVFAVAVASGGCSRVNRRRARAKMPPRPDMRYSCVSSRSVGTDNNIPPKSTGAGAGTGLGTGRGDDMT